MFLGICFIGLGIALLLGGLVLIGSANSDMHEILGAVICIAAWALAVWGMILYRLSAIGKAFSAIRAAQDAKGKHKTGAIEPEHQVKTPAGDSAPPHRAPAP